MPPAHELTAPSPRVPALAVPRVAVRYRVALAVLALTALTFLVPSAPTYDPWAWIVWGREIIHLDLSTVDGPSWKPLPVLLTTPFALFGSARAGPVAVRRARRRPRRRGDGLPRRAAPRRGVPAGAAAAGAYVVAPWMLRDVGAGQLRGPARRARAGRVRPPPRRAPPRRRFLFGVGAALLRPEAWPFLGLYGLWLLWREPRRAPARRRGLRRRCRCCGCCPSCGARATCCAPRTGRTTLVPTAPPSPRTRSREVVRQFATMLTPALWIGLGALVAMMVLRLGSGRRERRAASRSPSPPRSGWPRSP